MPQAEFSEPSEIISADDPHANTDQPEIPNGFRKMGLAPDLVQVVRSANSSRNFKVAKSGALVLCQTRELAQQMAHDVIDLVRHCRGLRVANVVGGMPHQMQSARLRNADLVFATAVTR